jgi:hypothetical protein
MSLVESAPTQPAAEGVAPLALSTVRARYPRLYREYGHLSDRENGTDDGSPQGEYAVDDETGLRTKIFFEDFAAPLSAEGDASCPMKADSDANRFCMFVWK